MEEENKEKQRLEIERHRLLYIELPNLLHRILNISICPLTDSKEFLKMDIEDIKKITNAECKNALSYLNNIKGQAGI
ncbi:MAG: hypothetical protein J5507_00320 [Clostridia bacterium]|nr:hypothetical protein [Clostridia bacterium]